MLNEMNNLLINAIDIEGFLYVNFIPVLIIFILSTLIILSYSTYINFKYNCPKCGAVNDITRIKKNKLFKKVGFSDAYRKYACGKCHNKFYVYNKNIENTKST